MLIPYPVLSVLWSPMSEIPKIGRRTIYFWTLLVFILLQLPIGYAVNMPMFLVFRALTGLFGSPALATGGGPITDLYNQAQSAYGVCGTVFGPIIGGFLTPVKGWRWAIWVVTWLGAFVLAMLFFLPPGNQCSEYLVQKSEEIEESHRRRPIEESV